MEVDLNENEEYKETELGLLPKEWEVVRLGDVAEFETGKRMKGGALKTGHVLSLGGEHIGDFGLINLSEPKFISKQFYDNLKKGKLNTGDVIICKDGAKTGKVAYISLMPAQYVAVNEHIFIIRSRDLSLLINQFIFSFIFSRIGQKQVREAYHGLIGGITNTDISNFKIPLPPLSEQKAIAYALSTIQTAKEKTEDIIKATKELKKSVMKHLFTYGPVPVEEAENVPLKETEIGLVPEDWEVVGLGDLFKNKNIMIRFGFPCGKWNDKGLGVPHLRPFNVSNDGQIVFKDLKFINIDRDINRYLLKKGDILFNNTNSEELVGKTAYWNKDSDFVLSNHMTIIRILNFDLINSQFLANYLHKKWYDGFYLKMCRRHVNQASISLARLEQIQVPFPPLPIQQKIASILSAIDQKIEAEESKKKALEDLFKSMLYNLMTAKIRVNHPEVS